MRYLRWAMITLNADIKVGLESCLQFLLTNCQRRECKIMIVQAARQIVPEICQFVFVQWFTFYLINQKLFVSHCYILNKYSYKLMFNYLQSLSSNIQNTQMKRGIEFMLRWIHTLPQLFPWSVTPLKNKNKRIVGTAIDPLKTSP